MLGRILFQPQLNDTLYIAYLLGLCFSEGGGEVSKCFEFKLPSTVQIEFQFY